MRINRILYNIHRLFFLSLLPHKYGSYLEGGLYKYNESTSALYKSKEESKSSVLFRGKVFGDKSSSINIFRYIFSKIYRVYVKNNNAIYDAQLIVISTSEKELKFFDFKGNSILTLYTDESRFNQILKKRIEWSNIFLVPPFDYDKENCTIVETLLKPIEISYEGYLEFVCRDECINAGLSQTAKCYLSPSDIAAFLKSIDREYMTQEVEKFISSNGYKCCITHGDLWRSNLIWSGQKLYYVDFEHVGERVFFYDLMMYLFSEFFLLNNKDAIRNYASGKFDSHISLVFHSANVIFDTSKRLIYFYVFLCLFYNERWKVLDDQSMLQKLSKLLNEVNI